MPASDPRDLFMERVTMFTTQSLGLIFGVEGHDATSWT
jgi:hypothetical protein